MDSEELIGLKKDTDPEIQDIKKKIKQYTLYAWWCVTIGFGIVFFAIALYLFDFDYTRDYFSLNLIGDFLGGTLGSIWSLAGIFFLYVAFLGQRLQLINQQNEIQISIQEIMAQRQEMEFQSITFERQQFENTFFNLVEMHQKIVSNIRYSDDTQGQASFIYFLDQWHQSVPGSIQSKEDLIKKFDHHYDRYLKRNLEHYFENFRQTLDFVRQFKFRSLSSNNDASDKEDIEARERKRYHMIYFSSMTSSEILLLNYWTLNKEAWLLDLFNLYGAPKAIRSIPDNLKHLFEVS